MKSITLLLAAGLLEHSNALHLVKRANPSVFHLPMKRQPLDTTWDGVRLTRRSKTVQSALNNEGASYVANVSLGTPAQDVQVVVDTGSSDLWVNTPSSQFCQDPQNGCSEYGEYTANNSKSYSFVNSLFNISYVDGSGSSGDFATDDFSFGGITLDKFQFGIGYTSSSAVGVLGIGYQAGEALSEESGTSPYPNFPAALVSAGYINTNAYSVWLNDLDASEGSILFGGVDTEKYTGKLNTLPVIKDSETNEYDRFIVGLTGMGANGQVGSFFSNEAVPVVLDSGSTLCYLPQDLVSVIYSKFSVSYNSRAGEPVVDCSLANSKDSIDFSFGSFTLEVPMSEMVVPYSVNHRNQQTCILGILPGSGEYLLGDSFIRSAYIVYDIDNNQISLAATNFNATKTNILEITKQSGVPDATGVPGAVSTGDTGNGAVRPNSPTKKGAGPPAATPHSFAAAAALAVGGMVYGAM